MRLLLPLCLTTIAAADPQAWPASGSEIELTWVIHPNLMKAGAMSARKAKVELEVKLGAVTQTIAAGENYGALSPLDQPLCNGTPRGAGAPPPVKLESGEVSKLVFGGGVVRGFAVMRPKPGELATVSFDRSDECGGKPVCPPTPISTLAIPARVTKFKQQIVLVDKAGNRTPFSCKVD